MKEMFMEEQQYSILQQQEIESYHIDDSYFNWYVNRIPIEKTLEDVDEFYEWTCRDVENPFNESEINIMNKTPEEQEYALKYQEKMRIQKMSLQDINKELEMVRIRK